VKYYNVIFVGGSAAGDQANVAVYDKVWDTCCHDWRLRDDRRRRRGCIHSLWRQFIILFIRSFVRVRVIKNKKAQLSLTNPRDAKACHKLLQFDVLTVQRCRWQYWSIFIRFAVGQSEICEIPRNSLKIQTYRVQGHPRSSILVPIESAYVLSY